MGTATAANGFGCGIVHVAATLVAAAALLTPAGACGQGSGADSAEVRALLETYVEGMEAPGVALAWARLGDSVRTVVAGVADRGTGRLLAPGDRFLAGSVGKTFVAAVTLTLVQDGALELDAPLTGWLGTEEWYPRLPNGGEVTLRMLLSHTSGIPDHVDDPDFARVAAERMRRADDEGAAAFRPDELVGFVLDDAPRFPPGTEYGYSDTNYILLGLVVEKATGRDYYDVLQERFLDPLGLEGTVPARGRRIEKLVTGYNPEGFMGLPENMVQGGSLVLDPASEWTGGGLASTAPDLARWMMALAEGRTALGEAGFELMLQGAPGGSSGSYGLGMSLGRSRHGLVVGHDGFFPGYRAKVAWYPELGLAVSALANSDRADLGGLVSRVAGLVAGEAPSRAASGESGPTPPALAREGSCSDPASTALQGVWPVAVTVPNGKRLEGHLELEEDADGALIATFNRRGLVLDGEVRWRLEGRARDGRFELVSVGGPEGAAAAEMPDVEGLVLLGEVTDSGMAGEYIPVAEGRRISRDMRWSTPREACR